MEKVKDAVMLTEQEYRKLTKKPRKTSNAVLIIVGAFLLAFIVTMIVTFWVKGAVPDTLIQYTLGAGGVEAVALSAIKIAKVKRGEKIEEE